MTPVNALFCDEALAVSWESAPDLFRAEQGIVHLWRADLSPPCEEECHSLPSDEWARAGRFHFQRDRDRYLCGRVFLRNVLGRYLEVAPSAIRFATGRHGKPQLADGRSGLRFNVSHSNDLLLLAVTPGREVGVDVEAIRPQVPCANLAGRYFRPAEAREIEALSGEAQVTRFYEIWTATEARLKADGCGLSGLLEARVADRWAWRNFVPAEGFAAAVAAEGGEFETECWTWTDEA